MWFCKIKMSTMLLMDPSIKYILLIDSNLRDNENDLFLSN